MTTKKTKKSSVKPVKKVIKKSTKKTNSSKRKSNIILRPILAVGSFFRNRWRRISNRASDFRGRRPHRSFYKTSHRDSQRGLKIKSYLSFTNSVFSLIWKNKRLFIKFLILYSILSMIIVGLMSQDTLSAFRDALDKASVTGINKWWMIFTNIISGSSNSSLSGVQQGLAVLLFLYGWLILIWLMRRIVNEDTAGLKLRDGIYSAGSPVIALAVLAVVLLVQLLPFAIVLLAYTSITAVGWINSGIAIENMAALCAMVVAAILTLYWVCSTFIALVIITLPGMYPMRAIKTAGDLIVGRRVKLVLRLIFMMVPVAVVWIVVLIPVIILDSWLKLSWLPILPILVLILSTLTIIWIAAYIYTLYRQIVDDPTPPVAKSARRSKKGKK